jgi:co-chaperonin GroES (HSP10)
MIPELVANGPAMAWTPPPRLYPFPEYLDLTPAQELELTELFPDVEPPYRPMHAWIVIQERLPRAKTKGGLILSAETQDRDRMDMNIGRIAAVGPLAFWSPALNREVPDEAKVQLGEFVRIPKFSADRPEENKVVWQMIELPKISAVITDVRAILR